MAEELHFGRAAKRLVCFSPASLARRFARRFTAVAGFVRVATEVAIPL